MNLYLRSNVILKAAWYHAMFFKEQTAGAMPASAQNFDLFVGMLVWAF